MGLFGKSNKQIAAELYACSRAVGEAYVSEATRRGLVEWPEPMYVLLFHPADHALELGYVLVAAAYELSIGGQIPALRHLHEWIEEVFARQALARHRRMHDALERMTVEDGQPRLPYCPPVPAERGPIRDSLEQRMAGCQHTIEAILLAHRDQSPHPNAAAYPLLRICFGGKREGQELNACYEEMLSDLFMHARNAVAEI